MLAFNKIVNKLLNKWWKIIFKKDIFEIIDPEKKEKNQNKLDKTIYRLLAEEVIIKIKAWVYIIPSPDDKKLNKIDLIDKYYFKLLKKYITSLIWSDYYISWQKALELHLKNFSTPEKIYIVNRELNKKIKIWEYEIIFKTISWNIENKRINLFSKLKKYRKVQNIENIDFKISNLELSLIESAIINDNNVWIDLNLLNKAIKKYKEIFDKEIFYEIWKYKFIMSFNRLKEISRNIDKELYLTFLDIIKRNWWLFIWEGLRGF